MGFFWIRSPYFMPLVLLICHLPTPSKNKKEARRTLLRGEEASFVGTRVFKPHYAFLLSPKLMSVLEPSERHSDDNVTKLCSYAIIFYMYLNVASERSEGNGAQKTLLTSLIIYIGVIANLANNKAPESFPFKSSIRKNFQPCCK